MSDAKTVSTWLYNAKGESKLVDHPEGAEAPKGWAFAPPSGVEVVVEGAAASSPATPAAMPGSVDERFLALEARVKALEAMVIDVSAEPEVEAKPSERDALVARAKELNIEFHHRTGEEKLRALIAEAETAKPEGEA
jgi:hypothetical protein